MLLLETKKQMKYKGIVWFTFLCFLSLQILHLLYQHVSRFSSAVVLMSESGLQWLIQVPGLTWGTFWIIALSSTFLSPESFIFTHLEYILSEPFAANTSVYLTYFKSKDKFRMMHKQMYQWINVWFHNKPELDIYVKGLCSHTCPFVIHSVQSNLGDFLKNTNQIMSFLGIKPSNGFLLHLE